MKMGLGPLSQFDRARLRPEESRVAYRSSQLAQTPSATLGMAASVSGVSVR